VKEWLSAGSEESSCKLLFVLPRFKSALDEFIKLFKSSVATYHRYPDGLVHSSLRSASEDEDLSS
jgi:hypothetical protein